jgi:ABC-type transport system involved in multi-copper enzyme maturation permease subunit
MSEITTAGTQDSLRALNLLRNPVAVRELRSRMRGRRAFVVLTIYTALMSTLVLIVYLAFSAASNNSFGPSSRQAGKAVFGAVLSIQVFLVIFIGPAFTSAAISGEKDRKTYDLLRTTLLPARSLVIGKLISALAYVFLLILVSIPLQSIAFLLGGLSFIELFLSQVLIIISAVTYALIGLYFSTVMRSTLSASVATFASALILTIGGPFLAGILGSLMGAIMFGPSIPDWTMQALLIYGGILLAATNLPATLIISEIFLLQEDTIFYWTNIIDGHTIFILSPWYLYSIFYILLGLILYWACVRRVKKVAKR